MRCRIGHFSSLFVELVVVVVVVGGRVVTNSSKPCANAYGGEGLDRRASTADGNAARRDMRESRQRDVTLFTSMKRTVRMIHTERVGRRVKRKSDDIYICVRGRTISLFFFSLVRAKYSHGRIVGREQFHVPTICSRQSARPWPCDSRRRTFPREKDASFRKLYFGI